MDMFQFLKGTIRPGAGAFAPLTGVCFNSSKVRYDATAEEKVRKHNKSFNSSKVRYDQFQKNHCPFRAIVSIPQRYDTTQQKGIIMSRKQLFQFLKGTIRQNGQDIIGKDGKRFNSSKVRYDGPNYYPCRITG